jgi:DNA repair protein RadC
MEIKRNFARERVEQYGPQQLSDQDLLVAATGMSEEEAYNALAGGLRSLGDTDTIEAIKISGGKRAQLRAAMELGRRVYAAGPDNKIIIRTPDDIASVMMSKLRYETKEHFVALFLSTKNHVLKIETISTGTLNASIVHPRELFKAAVKANAASIILCHNHPSGDPQPSPEDITLTHKLVDAAKMMDIPVLDHVIIGDGRYVSMKERNIL